MNEPIAAPDTVELSHGEALPRHSSQRLWDLSLVLFVSFAVPIASSAYSLLGGTRASEPLARQFRLYIAIIGEVSSLLVLWHILFRQGRRWRDIGWSFRMVDVPIGIGLFLATHVAAALVDVLLQSFYRSFSGHFLVPKPLNLGLGVSAASVALICMNPFFEELIVRAYTMSEIFNATGRQWLAIVVSVAVQMSYHLYQGPVRAVGLVVMFLLFSLYFAKTRRIMPVILAHLGTDLLILVRGGR